MNIKNGTEENLNPNPHAGNHGRRILFIDRDGTLIKEAPPTYQLDAFAKLEFYPHVFEYLTRIVKEFNYELVMVTNQDGLGTPSFPEDSFWPIQNFILKALENEGIIFSKICIDRSFPYENKATRKPGTGMLTEYMNSEKYDMQNSFVIGDRITDVKLADNLGCKALWLNNHDDLGSAEVAVSAKELSGVIAVESQNWEDFYEFLKRPPRRINHSRNTNETKIEIDINLDGKGISNIQTGLGFFDHMLEQVSKHSGIDLHVTCKGDLHIDEHHTIEDVALALGEATLSGLGNKLGIERYGFVLPMDDCLAQVAIDFGGRSWLVWDVEFKREKIGEMPTEMFYHFFKSFSDAAKCNLNIKVEGHNEHHKIESVFKAFAKSIKMAIRRRSAKQFFTNNKRLTVKTAIIQYNAGNVQSVLYALQRLGVDAVITDDPAEITGADKVIFPGVGNAASAMGYLKKTGLDKVITSLQQPVLGICLGLQLLCNESEEGDTKCLGIFDVTVKKFANPKLRENVSSFKVPQMGWNTITNLSSPLFNDIKENSFVYYVHSYYAELSPDTIATTDYITPYSAAIRRDNFYGVQFHSEKSASTGIQIISNFLKIS